MILEDEKIWKLIENEKDYFKIKRDVTTNKS